jgi:hypothetical protein
MKKEIFHLLRLLSAHAKKKFVRFLNLALLAPAAIRLPAGALNDYTVLQTCCTINGHAVVDDDYVIQEHAKNTFEKIGVSASAFSNGGEYLAGLADGNFDAVP